mmetsp:Transcript_56371/g.158112  ORF Transcript_56371/g.158112 Transcript_56371/m.158112 type:complete len:122 (-) Transcript_56371:55-420(-)
MPEASVAQWPAGRTASKQPCLAAAARSAGGKAGGGKRGPAKVLKDAGCYVTKPDIRRLARRAGCVRVATTIYEEARSTITDFIEKLVGDAVVYMDYGGRKTMAPSDIVLSLRRRGKVVYGS